MHLHTLFTLFTLNDFYKFSIAVIGKKESVLFSYNNHCSYPDASDNFSSLVYVLQGTIVVQASSAGCNFRSLQLIIGVTNHFIQ